MRLFRRRTMMQPVKADDVPIPVGVNLFDPDAVSNGYWNYNVYVDDSNYRRFILPFDSGADFVAAYIFNTGSAVRLKLADQNGNVCWSGGNNVTNIPGTLKTAALNYEQSHPGIKLVSFYANCKASNLSSVVWMRTS